MNPDSPRSPRLALAQRAACLFAFLAAAALPLHALQEKLDPAGVEHVANHGAQMDFAYWFGILELPFLFITIFFAFRTSRALKGGVFGKGMSLMAWGFLVMAVGHLHMQAKHLFDFDLFTLGLGRTGGMVAWFLALVTTWLLSGLGFYSIFKASRAA